MWRRSLLFQCSGAFRHPSKSAWMLSSWLDYSTASSKKKRLPSKHRSRNKGMIDRFTIHAKGGDGGKGCSSLNHNRRDAHGRPDGGDGGRGGDVIFEGCPMLWDYSNLQHHVNAKRGGNGSSLHKDGSRGGDKIIRVPIGTVIHLVKGEVPYFVNARSAKELFPWEIPNAADDSFESQLMSDSTSPAAVDETKTQENSGSSSPHESAHVETHGGASSDDKVEHSREDGAFRGSPSDTEREEESEGKEAVLYDVAELTQRGQQILVARGGEGGPGNGSVKFQKLFKKKALGKGHAGDEAADDNNPSLHAGQPGAEAVLILELKSIADVGLVGIPNAGKSTLLGAISRARPQVGNYAFTTLKPSIGKLNYEDYFSTTVADIPGLIRGAHENRGLGHAFLRHIERTRVLVYVLDLASAIESPKGTPPWEQLRDLALELEFYREGLSRRPALIVANKTDEIGAGVVLEELKRRVKGIPIFPVCAVLEEGVSELKAGLRKVVDGEESYCLDLNDIAIE